MEHITQINGAWDKRDKDPSKNYGIHGVEMRFVLKGPEGAVQFLLYTGWHLPEVTREIGQQKPMPADLGYHSPTPRHEGQEQMNDGKGCEYLDGKPCYYDGSGCNAYGMWEVLLKEGSEGVWKALECVYSDLFTKDHPTGDACNCPDYSAYQRLGMLS